MLEKDKEKTVLKMPDEEEVESVIYEIATPPNDDYYRRNIEHFSKNANKLRKVEHRFRFIYFFRSFFL